jgi:hypothetical protein
MLPQEGWISTRVDEELSHAIEWAAVALERNDGPSSSTKSVQGTEYTVSYEYDRAHRKWVKARIQFPANHGEPVQVGLRYHGVYGS